jgi:hypothetical protein
MRSSILTAAVLAFWACGIAADERRQEIVAGASIHWESPVDPTAGSALISATHLLEFELMALNIEAETREPAGGLSRELVMHVDVKRVFKSDAPSPELGRASLRLRQTGLDPMGMAAPPPLDPEALRPGDTFLLDAVAPGARSLNAIFEGARGVYPGDFAVDAALAQQAEANGVASQDASSVARLLLVTQESRHTAHDLWGDYFLMHFRDRFHESPREAIPAVARIALEPDTNPRLAITLLAEIDLVMLDHTEDAELVSKLGLALLRALPGIPDLRVRSYVASRNIHGLVFDGDDLGAAQSDRFGADPQTIASARDAISDATDERARSVYRWIRWDGR